MPDKSAVEVRLAILQAWVTGVIVFMLTLFITGVLVLAYVLTHQRNEANNVLACYVEDSAKRSKRALPQIKYYRDNPDQMALALKQINESLDAAHDAFGSCHKD